MKAPDFSFDTPWEKSLRFYKSMGKGATILFFLRYAGCPICQMKLSEIIHDWERFKRKGCAVFVVIQSEPEVVKSHLFGEEISFKIICDPKEELFALYGVKPGGILGYIAPSVIAKAVKATKKGFKHGKKEGKEMQLPAVFIIDNAGTINYAYYGKNVGDLPNNSVLIDRLG
jgi:peroxiredoxin